VKRQDLGFISLFSGCGGSSVGYTKSGFRSLLAVDNDEKCCENYKLNFPEVKVLNFDLTSISSNDILNEIDLGVGELEFLDSSPPCQGFSVAGKRVVFDSRNLLIFKTVDLISGVLPKVFLIENVEGLIIGKMKGIFNEVLIQLKNLNYEVKWKSLNSIYYGVPQSRQRVFIIGVRKDLGLEPIFPSHTGEVKFIGDVINDIDFHSRGQFDKKLKSPNSFAYTLTKSPSMYFVQNGRKRKPTIEELKILQGFPPDFKFSGNYNEIWSMIGNSVPPPLAFEISRVLKTEIFEKI
jgi:DNA (cytosine-5)-methyltransferase 1